MKKILTLLITLALLVTMAGCGGGKDKPSGGGEQEPPVEPVIKGEVKDAGRFSVLVPEGWTMIDMGGYSDPFTAVLLKGTQEDWFKVPQVSIIYNLPCDLVVSSAALADNVIQKPDFDLGPYHWKQWTGSMSGYKMHVAETEGDFGYFTVSLQAVTPDGECPSIDDEEVRAILKSIVGRPTIDVDWIKFVNGNATAELKGVEGYNWDDNGSMQTSTVEAEYTVNGNTVEFTGTSGSGVVGVDLVLENDLGTKKMGEASMRLRIEDGKFVGAYNATMKILDEPEDIEIDDWTDNTDYEAIDAFLVDAWRDVANDLNMLIQRYDELQHGYLVTIYTPDNKTIVMPASVQPGGLLEYYEATINGESVGETSGWFSIDGDTLLWGHDDAVGVYDSTNIFQKPQG